MEQLKWQFWPYMGIDHIFYFRRDGFRGIAPAGPSVSQLTFNRLPWYRGFIPKDKEWEPVGHHDRNEMSRHYLEVLRADIANTVLI
jgi:hypothetical protein